MTPSGRIVIAAALAALVAGMPVDAAAKKNRLKATVNGQRLKSAKRLVIALYATTSFSVNGTTKLRRGVVRSITVNCGPVDIRTAALPATFTGCFGAYTEARPRGPVTFKQWASSTMELTVESFDGSRIVGTFRGVIEPTPSNPSEPPAAVEEGIFSVAFTDVGV